MSAPPGTGRTEADRSRLHHRILILLLTAVFAGCGQAPSLDRLPSDAVILAFGDSLTHGTGARPDQSYPAVLERRTGRRVINAGEPGELSDEGRRRLPGVLDRVEPALLILCHGGNDILRNRSPATVADNLLAMIDMARERGIGVVLVGVPERTLLFHDTADLYHEVAEQARVPLEDATIADIVGDPALKSDAVHPNAAGYRQLALAIEALLREAGAL